VRESVRGPTKDGETRIVPVLDELHSALTAWKLKTGGKGLVVPAMRRDGKRISKRIPGPHLARVLKQLGLHRAGLGWYEATRHTFACQWVMRGGSMYELKEILGHYSITVTEKHDLHLRPEHFRTDLGLLNAENRQKTGSAGEADSPNHAEPKKKMPEWSCKPSSVPALSDGQRTFI
jgi:integrase